MTTQLVEIENAYDGFPGIMIQAQDPKEGDLDIVVYLDENLDGIGIDIYDAITREIEFDLFCDKHDVDLMIEALQRIQKVDVF